jgi:hypothetical protein
MILMSTSTTAANRYCFTSCIYAKCAGTHTSAATAASTIAKLSSSSSTPTNHKIIHKS